MAKSPASFRAAVLRNSPSPEPAKRRLSASCWLLLPSCVFLLANPSHGLNLLMEPAASPATRAKTARGGVAGAEGFEPPLAVLEAAGLPLNLRPSFTYSVLRRGPSR